MPVEDGRVPVPQILHIGVHGPPGGVVQAEFLDERRQVRLGEEPELLDAGGHERVDDVHRLLRPAAQVLLDHRDGVGDLPFELGLLAVGEEVVEQARLVHRGGLHGADRPGLEDLVRDLAPGLELRERHGEFGAEGPAAHLDVVHRVGDPVLVLRVQLPHPGLDHDGDGGLELGAGPLVELGGGALPQVGQALLDRVGRGRRRAEVQRQELQEPPVLRERGSEVAAAAEHGRVVVVAVRAPGEPVRGGVELRLRRVGVDAGGAEREVEPEELLPLPQARARQRRVGGEEAHGLSPCGAVAPGLVESGVELQRVRQVDLGQRHRSDPAERFAQMLFQTRGGYARP